MVPKLPLRMFKLALLGAGLGAIAVSGARADMTLVRLTPEEYQRTIHDVFGPSIQLDANVVETGFRDQGLLAVGTVSPTTDAPQTDYEMK